MIGEYAGTVRSSPPVKLPRVGHPMSFWIRAAPSQSRALKPEPLLESASWPDALSGSAAASHFFFAGRFRFLRLPLTSWSEAKICRCRANGSYSWLCWD